MLNKLYIYIVCLSCVLFLSGCGSNVDGPVLVFESPLQIQIPEGYEEVSPGTVENKQITNKVLKAYKKIDEDGELSFLDNLVITKSAFTEPLDYDQFWSVNQRLMINQLVGYQPGSLERTSFECNGQRINTLLVDFAIQSESLQYFAQTQFVKDNIGYIVSFASSDEGERDSAKKWIVEINCGESEKE